MTKSGEQQTVLVAEDDGHTARLIALYLDRQGFRPLLAPDGQAALDLFQTQRPALVILDLMLPVIDGWRVCQIIRETSAVPIIMLTARGEEEDRVRGLDLGADDYVVKPFSPRELMARVAAVLRRAQPESPPTGRVLAHGELRLDLDKRAVKLGGLPLSLTPHEYHLLAALMSHPGKTFTRQELLDSLYPEGEAVVDRVVDVHIGKLRQKLGAHPQAPGYIVTVRGMGYRFSEP